MSCFLSPPKVLLRSSQSQEAISQITTHGTHGCIRCGKMEMQDSETAGLVRLLSFPKTNLQQLLFRCFSKDTN